MGLRAPWTLKRYSLLAVLMLSLSCGGKPETSSDRNRELSNSTETSRLERGSDTAATSVEETIAVRLDRVIEKANTTHASLLSFTETIFNDGLRQGKILSCSAYRILMLTGRSQLNYDELDQFANRLSTLTYPSNLITFAKGSDIAIWIPLSVPYERSLGRKVGKLGYSSYQPWRLAACEEEYKAPVPNGERARNEERQRFAQMIVRARLRLEYYEKLLPEIEVKASRAVSLKASLGAARGDLSIDLNPEMAAVKVREYENFLNASVEALSQWRREAAVDTLVEADEIDNVLAIASREMPEPLHE